MSQAKGQLARAPHVMHVLRRALAATEGRLVAANSRVQDCEQEMQQLRGQVGGASMSPVHRSSPCIRQAWNAAAVGWASVLW